MAESAILIPETVVVLITCTLLSLFKMIAVAVIMTTSENNERQSLQEQLLGVRSIPPNRTSSENC